MASTAQSHPAFPTRPYASTLHGKLPERNPPSAFSASANPSARENARLDRERARRDTAPGGAGPGPANPLDTLTDEQREEISEAVGAPRPCPTGTPSEPFWGYDKKKEKEKKKKNRERKKGERKQADRGSVSSSDSST